MTYTEVADILRKPNTSAEEKLQSKLQNKHSALLLQFDNLNSLFSALRIAREKSGAMDFQSTETRLIFGEDKKLKEIIPVERNDAHRMIEECMLCANIAAARLIEGFKLPALFRTHEGPNPEKLENVREFLSGLGLYLGGGEKPAPSDYAKVLLAASSRPDSRLLNTMLIRSMMQAVYQADNIGHFGLGFSAYTHFTSPIRRYPDLLVHRAIKYLIHNKSSAHLKRKTPLKTVSKQAIYPYTEAEINSLGVACSESERRADSAGYSVLDWFKCEYMQERVGDEFLGTITTVMSFGLFVELDNIYIEGLVHISELSNDYYHFDPVNHCLEGERTRKIYRLGDKIDVRVVRVDLEEKKIDLQIKGLPDKSNSKIKNQRRTKKDPSVRGSKSKKKNTQQSGEKNKKNKKKNVNSKKRLVSGRSSTEKKKIKKRSRKSASKLSKKSH
jgi:ribonuclease R